MLQLDQAAHRGPDLWAFIPDSSAAVQDVFLLVQLRDLPLRQELPRLLVDRGRNLLRERMHLRRRSRVWLLTAAASGGVGRRA